MSFPTTAVLSTFTGANEDPLSEGGAWTTAVGINGLTGSLERLSNQCGSRSGNAFWNATTFARSGGVEVFVTIPTLPGNGLGGSFIYWLDAITTTANGYSVDWRLTGGTPTMRVIKYTAGSGSTIDTFTQAFNAGDKIGMEITPTHVRSYVFTGGAWSLVGTPTNDTTFSGSGYLALGQSDANAFLDDFGGGSTVAAAEKQTYYVRRPVMVGRR